jgi:hypothetical protein
MALAPPPVMVQGTRTCCASQSHAGMAGATAHIRHQLPGCTWLNILAMVTSVVRFCFCLAAFSSGMSSSRFLECTQNRLRPMLKGLHSGSVTCEARSPAGDAESAVSQAILGFKRRAQQKGCPSLGSMLALPYLGTTVPGHRRQGECRH